MSDSNETDNETGEERLRYVGATTRHEGSGEKAHPLPKIPVRELGIDDLQPGVTGDAEPVSRSKSKE